MAVSVDTAGNFGVQVQRLVWYWCLGPQAFGQIVTNMLPELAAFVVLAINCIYNAPWM